MLVGIYAAVGMAKLVVLTGLAVLLLIGLGLMEFLLRMRERSQWKPQ
jgi:hypothetical protein